MGKGGSFLAPYHAWENRMAPAIKKIVETRKAEILNGTFRVDIDESAPKSE
jgi:hypothetical protein